MPGPIAIEHPVGIHGSRASANLVQGVLDKSWFTITMDEIVEAYPIETVNIMRERRGDTPQASDFISM